MAPACAPKRDGAWTLVGIISTPDRSNGETGGRTSSLGCGPDGTTGAEVGGAAGAGRVTPPTVPDSPWSRRSHPSVSANRVPDPPRRQTHPQRQCGPRRLRPGRHRRLLIEVAQPVRHIVAGNLRRRRKRYSGEPTRQSSSTTGGSSSCGSSSALNLASGEVTQAGGSMCSSKGACARILRSHSGMTSEAATRGGVVVGAWRAPPLVADRRRGPQPVRRFWFRGSFINGRQRRLADV